MRKTLFGFFESLVLAPTFLILTSINLIAVPITWTGNINTSWSMPGNWSPSQIPSNNDNVTIPNVAMLSNNFPVLDAPGVNISNLLIQSSATLNLGIYDINISGDLICGGTLSGNNNLILIGNLLTIQSGGSVAIDLSNFNVSGGIICAGDLKLTNTNLNIAGNLSILTASNVEFISNSSVTISGNITGGGTLSGGNGTITIDGDISVTNFYSDNSSVILKGAATQNIDGYMFYNLTISGGGKKIFNGDVSVLETLSMISGNIDLSSHNFSLGVSENAKGTLSYFSGNIMGAGTFTRYFDDLTNIPVGDNSGLFPMGTNSQNRSLWIGGQPSSGGGGPVSVKYNDDSGTTGIVPAYFEQDSVNIRYNANWEISTPFNKIQGNSFSLRIQGNGIPEINDFTKLNVSLGNSPAPGNYSISSGSNSEPLVNRTGLAAADLNNSFYFASQESINPLPVVLTRFTASYINSNVDLIWQTASEINNSHFEIERSHNTFDWMTITSVAGNNNPCGVSNYTYIDNPEKSAGSSVIYYRLKQFDNNGSFEYSCIRSVNLSPDVLHIETWPNPATNVLNIRLNPFNDEGMMVAINDINGRTVYSENIYSTGGPITRCINISRLNPGFYYLTVYSGGVPFSEKVCFSH